MNRAHFTPRTLPGSSRGFTLIEMMIALVLGLVILIASLAVYNASSRGSQLSQMETQLNEDGILALNLIQQQIKQAGYSSQVIPSNGATIMGNYRGPAVRGCDFGFADSGVAFASLACATTGSGGSAIAIRYEATVDNTVPTAPPSPLPTNCVGNGINATTLSDVSPAPAAGGGSYALADNRYMVTTSGNQPTLSCRGAEKSGKANVIGSSQPLLVNVESMQMLYGVATIPSAELAANYNPLQHQIVSYNTAAEVSTLTNSGTFTSPADATLDSWGRVLSVRVCLVMRSDQPARDAPDGAFTYKDCNNIDTTATDGYLRRTYTTTVLLRNRLLTQ